MTNQCTRTTILIGLLLLAVSCQAETSTSGTTTTATPNAGSAGQTAGGGLRARLELPHTLPLGEPVKVQFFLVNDSSENLFVLNWFTPLEGLGGDIFQVRRDGLKNSRSDSFGWKTKLSKSAEVGGVFKASCSQGIRLIVSDFKLRTKQMVLCSVVLVLVSIIFGHGGKKCCPVEIWW